MFPGNDVKSIIYSCENTMRATISYLQTRQMIDMRKTNNYGRVNVVEDSLFQYGVTDNDGNIIVPFGKYAWISGFDHGLARVKSIFGIAQINLETSVVENPKWGIIDMDGNEVLPVEYDEVWNFQGKERSSTRVIKDGQNFDFDLNGLVLRENTPRSHQAMSYMEWSGYDREEKYGSHYGKYAGSYAQDVMGYSDDVIDDVFEGDPDAYWNID